MASVCIICSKEAHGNKVEDTQVITLIRAVKKKLNIASNNTLVVCENCAPEHAKKRKAFEQKLMLYCLGGAVLLAISIVLPIVSGRGHNLFSILMVLLLAIFLVALAFLNYVPPVEKGAEPKKDETKTGLLENFADKHFAKLSDAPHHKEEKKGLASIKTSGKKGGRRG